MRKPILKFLYRLFFFLGWILFMQSCGAKDLLLLDGGKTTYTIGTARGLAAEQAAALMLKEFIMKQTGVAWKVINGQSALGKPSIIIRQQPYAVSTGTAQIVITSGNRDIELAADSNLLKTAVAFFLERFANTHVYSDTVVDAPRLTRLTVPANYRQIEKPAFPIRLLFEKNAFDPLFISWHGLSNIPSPDNPHRSHRWILLAHTFFDLVPATQYYHTHPEYFSLRDGKRVPMQLCLSNKTVLDIAVSNLAKKMKEHPEANQWGVSQMDNQEYCQCENCTRIATAEKSQSGPIVRFVNEIAKQFPNKIIGTLAYQYSRNAPALTKPQPNVTMIVCSIESDRSKPLDDPRQKDDFASDLRNWRSISTRVMVWDYVVNFLSISSAYPNFQVLQPNLLFFQQLKINTVFEHGWHYTGNALQDYRTYLLAKLLWNPNQSVNKIEQDFFMGFYGKAGPVLMHVLDSMDNAFVASGASLTNYEHPANHANDYLSASLRAYYLKGIQSALKLVKDNAAIYKRVDAFAQAFRVAEVEVNEALIGKKAWVDNYTPTQRLAFKAYNDSIVDEVAWKAKTYGPRTMLENSLTVNEWKLQIGTTFQPNAENNKAIGGNITFKFPSIKTFEGMGPDGLIDGTFGTADWGTTWQGWHAGNIDALITLKNTTSLSYFNMHIMKDVPYDIVLPEYVEVQTSADGVHFIPAGKVVKPVAGPDEVREVVEYAGKLCCSPSVKYVHVIAKYPGSRIVGNTKKDFYLFSDEIYLR